MTFRHDPAATRRAKIVESAEARDKPNLAEHLAAKTALTVAQALAALAAAPSEAAEQVERGAAAARELLAGSSYLAPEARTIAATNRFAGLSADQADEAERGAAAVRELLGGSRLQR